MSESPKARFWSVEFEQLTRPEQVFRVIWELEAEVNNGGFCQYFENAAGDLAWFAATALEEIDAVAAAKVVQEACSVFAESNPPKDREERQAALKSGGADALKRLDTLDQKFISYPDDLSDLLQKYVSKHRDEIAGT